MNVLAQLSDAFLARHFDAGTLQRAREVVAAGFVRRPEIGLLSAGSVTATAEVQGSRVVPYQVQLHAEAPSDTYAGWLFTVCTCPVQAPCKQLGEEGGEERRGTKGDDRRRRLVSYSWAD